MRGAKSADVRGGVAPHQGKARWYPGKAEAVHAGCFVDVRCGDGDMEKKVQESMVRVKSASACASKGGLKKGYACETPAGGRRWCNGSGSHTRASQPHAYDTYSPCITLHVQYA